MSRIWFSADPGKTGAISVWENKNLIEVIDYNRDRYKEIFTKYKEYKPFLLCEKIDTVYAGVFAGFVLGKFIGELMGMSLMSDIEFITLKSTPREWKSPWSHLIKKKGEKWEKDEGKKRYCDLCKELYPQIDLFGPEYDKNGNIETYKKDNKNKGIKAGDTKLELKDGRAAAVLIGRSFIERGLLDEFLKEEH